MQQLSLYSSYQPLKWPPDLALAQLHLKCSGPGVDNPCGIKCPCCQRVNKLKTRNWYNRDLLKDFKTFGGGVPSYFQLLKYCIVTMIVLVLIINIYHIYILETICSFINSQYQAKGYGKTCENFLIFKLCQPEIIYNALIERNRQKQAQIFLSLQLVSFLILIAATIGMKIWIQRTNRKIEKSTKLFSDYSLIIKNIPTYTTITELKDQLSTILEKQKPDSHLNTKNAHEAKESYQCQYVSFPNIEKGIKRETKSSKNSHIQGSKIKQLFFLYEIAQLQNISQKLFDLHYDILYTMEEMKQGHFQDGSYYKKLNKFITYYEQLGSLNHKIGQNNGRAIVVFNCRDDRDLVMRYFHMNQCNKLIFYTMQMFTLNTRSANLIADKIAQPQQIVWRYVGQSSVIKSKVRMETTLLGLGFVLLAFTLLYFPILKINEANILDRSIFNTALSILISTLLQALAIIYRQIIIKLIPRRKPSSYDSQSYFIVSTTVIFHFIFYLVTPISYYSFQFEEITKNLKLRQLFIAVLTFLVMSLIIALIDVKYLLFKSKIKKLLKQKKQWGKLCQIRLHQQIQWPSFPIEFKLMVVLNIWSFNAFYTFLVPYLLIPFIIVLFLIYWVDKKNIYKHYKMKSYLSIDLQIAVQREYIIIFLICACAGYVSCSFYVWQYAVSGIVFILSIFVNMLINYRVKEKLKKEEQLRVSRTKTLDEILRGVSLKSELRQTFLCKNYASFYQMPQRVTDISLGSKANSYSGYFQAYQEYLSRFKNEDVGKMLAKTYRHCRRKISDVRTKTYLLTNIKQLLQNQQQEEEKKKQKNIPFKESENEYDNSITLSQQQTIKDQPNEAYKSEQENQDKAQKQAHSLQ